jgi:hypothetical protein
VSRKKVEGRGKKEEVTTPVSFLLPSSSFLGTRGLM